MEHQMELYRFVKFTTQLFSQQIKELSDEELQVLISILNTETSRNGLKYASQREMSIDSRLIYINVQLLVINLCESLKQEMKLREENGANYYKKERLPVSHTFFLKEILIKLTRMLTKTTD